MDLDENRHVFVQMYGKIIRFGRKYDYKNLFQQTFDYRRNTFGG